MPGSSRSGRSIAPSRRIPARRRPTIGACISAGSSRPPISPIPESASPHEDLISIARVAARAEPRLLPCWRRGDSRGGSPMNSFFPYVIYFTPVVIVIAAVEALVIAWVKKRGYNWRAAAASLVDALGREYIVYKYLPFGLALPVIALAWNHRIATVPLSGPVAFGLLFIERDDLPCRYGLVKPLTSNNPFVINFHEWAALLRDLRQARSWRERWSYLFGAPGWKPGGQGWTTEDLRRAAPAGAEYPA